MHSLAGIGGFNVFGSSECLGLWFESVSVAHIGNENLMSDDLRDSNPGNSHPVRILYTDFKLGI